MKTQRNLTKAPEVVFRPLSHRLRELRQFPQGHTATTESRNSSPALSDSKVLVLTPPAHTQKDFLRKL